MEVYDILSNTAIYDIKKSFTKQVYLCWLSNFPRVIFLLWIWRGYPIQMIVPTVTALVAICLDNLHN